MTDPHERTVSCHATGLIGGTGHELQATLGIGALLPAGLVKAIGDGKPVDELRPIEVRIRVLQVNALRTKRSIVVKPHKGRRANTLLPCETVSMIDLQIHGDCVAVTNGHHASQRRPENMDQFVVATICEARAARCMRIIGCHRDPLCFL